MIVVIADDFTGAAELGGIGLRYNLRVEVNTQVNLQSTADLLVIATDTRSMQKHEAVFEMEKVTENIAKLNPTLIFKKVDSVLRGYVAEELLVHIQKLSHSRALLVPANPALGRTIINGKYLLNSNLLHLSNFSSDPEFPVKTSSVIELLQDKGIEIYSQKHHQTLKYEGIIVGDAADTDDLRAWADCVNRNMIIAGAAGFFTALLDKLVIPDEQTEQIKPREFKEPALIVSGTSYSKSYEAVKKLKESGAPVSYMPAGIIRSNTVDKEKYQDWCLEIIAYITTFGKAIIAIDPLDTKGLNDQAKSLRDKTAIVVKMVFDQIKINELLIEGGSTASAVLKQLGISQICPVEELAPGVIRMRANDNPELYITMKPGSYSWPDSIRQYSLY
jgi:uncharacterized protein YgbK (DUF1537 family)